MRTLITVFRITEISLESFSKAFAFILSFEIVAAAADRIEWEGALIKGVSAFREIIGAVRWDMERGRRERRRGRGREVERKRERT